MKQILATYQSPKMLNLEFLLYMGLNRQLRITGNISGITKRRKLNLTAYMKRISFILFFLFFVNYLFSANRGSESWMNEPFRPQFHFSPPENRMGSPISIIRIDTVYHLFYQWNPHNLQQGYMNWGHATSTDLVKWNFDSISVTAPAVNADSMDLSPWWGTAV